MNEQSRTPAERREEALFSLLMAELAEEWEREALAENERLRDDPSAQPRSELDQRCLGAIRRHYTEEKRRRTGHAAWKLAKRVLLAACLGISLFAVAFATSERVRVDTMNFLISVSETNTMFRFRRAPEKDVRPRLSVGWVPEGYTLTEQFGDESWVWFDYYDQEGHILKVDCTATKGATINIDTEDAQVETVSVQGDDAMLITKNTRGDIQLVWPAKDNTLFLTVYSDGLSREELLKVAESLAY